MMVSAWCGEAFIHLHYVVVVFVRCAHEELSFELGRFICASNYIVLRANCTVVITLYVVLCVNFMIDR